MSSNKFSAERIHEIGARLLEIQETRNRFLPTTLWVSDLHGEGEKFIKVLRGRFGMLYTTCQEALAEEDNHKIKQFTKIIRQKKWTENLGISKSELLTALIRLLQYKLGEEQKQKSKLLENSLSRLLLHAYKTEGIPPAFFEQEELFEFSVRHLSETLLSLIPDHIVILGDIFDRGPTPDKIIRTLNLSFLKAKTYFIWVNHDVLWLGAAAGSSSLLAETMRITCRYGHLDFLDRLKIEYKTLLEFAKDLYPSEKITGNFKAKDPACKSMEKALSLIQFKLEEKTILENPDFEMGNRLWLNKLVVLLKNKQEEELTDLNFPTLDFKNPQALSADENYVLETLKKSWEQSKKLKNLLKFMIHKGKVFEKYQGFLNMHALIPSTADGEFESFQGQKGQKLLLFFEQVLQRVGNRYLYSQPQTERDFSLLFYLWCGPKSPLFGKDAMKTFERYFLKDKKHHKETTLHWEKNLRNPAFKKKIQTEFEVQRVIYGHTPRDFAKGDKITTEDGFGINIDGGFSGAYLNRGHALVRTPQYLYGIILPTDEEADKILNENQALPLMVEMVDYLQKPIQIKDLAEGEKLQKEWNQLLAEMHQLTKIQYKSWMQAEDEY